MGLHDTESLTVGTDDRAAFWVACGIALLAFSVRIRGALDFAFWQDEVGSARAMLERSPFDVALHVARFESTPPAFYVVGWAVHSAGVSLEAVRTVSALAGALLAGGLVLYARRLIPLWASGLAGLSVALGHQFVLHGRELRSYELHALLCLVLAAAVLAFNRSPDRARAVVLALVVAAGSLTNYFFLLSIAAVLVWCWRSLDERYVQRRMTWAIVAGLLPFVVWLPAMVKQYGHRGAYTYISSFRVNEVVTTYWHEFVRAEPQTGLLRVVAPALLAVAVLAGCVRLSRLSDAGRLTALLATLPVVIAAVIWLAGPHIYDVRNMIGAGPFAAVALAAVVSAVPARLAAVTAGIAVLLVVSGFVRSDRVQPVPYDRVAEELVAQGWRPSDAIVLGGNFYAFRGPLEWYLPQHPELTLGEPLPVRCPRLYVVATRGPLWHETLTTSSVEESTKVRGVLVARIGTRDMTLLRRLLREGGRLLVSANSHARCVRAVPERRLNDGTRTSAPNPA